MSMKGLNLAGLHGKTVERTVEHGIEFGRVVGGFQRAAFEVLLVAVKPSGSIEKWVIDGSLRLSSMAIAEREGVPLSGRIATHDHLEQHARDVVDHCRNRYEGQSLHYAVICWDELKKRRWGMAASYSKGPLKIENARSVLTALFDRVLAGDDE